jgi:hypothetical protein
MNFNQNETITASEKSIGAEKSSSYERFTNKTSHDQKTHHDFFITNWTLQKKCQICFTYTLIWEANLNNQLFFSHIFDQHFGRQQTMLLKTYRKKEDLFIA